MTKAFHNLTDLRPGMEHLNFKVTVIHIKDIRKVKTFSGIEHVILEGQVSDGHSSLPLAVWNEKIDSFKNVTKGDTIEISDCFVTSFKGVLQLNVGRGSSVIKTSE